MNALLEISVVLAALGATVSLVFWAARPTSGMYVVKRGTNELGGIPFYLKKAVTHQKTSYLERRQELHLRIVRVEARGDKRVETPLFDGTKVVRWPDLAMEIAEVERALDRIVGSRNPANEIEVARSLFRDLPWAEESAPARQRLQLEANTMEREVYVDYSEELYINRLQPRSGSAESTLTLAADGTLTKAAGKVTDNELETLAEMIPTASVIEKLISAGAPTDDRAPRFARDEERIEVAWRRDPALVRHTLVVRHDANQDFLPPIRWPDELGSWVGGYSCEPVSLALAESGQDARGDSAADPGKPAAPSPGAPTDEEDAEIDAAPPSRGPAVRGDRATDYPPATFELAEGVLEVVVECGHAHAGSYTLRLWDGDRMIAKRMHRDYGEDEVLGRGVDQRLIDCFCVVARLDDQESYALTVIVTQDGEEIGRDERDGQFDGRRATERIVLRMKEA